jgi:hypothetical protein
MIAANSRPQSAHEAACHARFLQMLPAIRKIASFCFRREPR